MCPQCSNTSIKFDPYLYLSVPLPIVTTRVVIATVIFADVARVRGGGRCRLSCGADAQNPCVYGVTVEKDASILDFKHSA